MSTPSIKSPRSPPRQWLSNDEQPNAARRSSEHVASDQAGPSETIPAPTGSSTMAETDPAPPINYAIDENLFYSAPSQPLADTDAQDISDPAAHEANAPVPPPDFKPFFTLIEDPETGEHHHPTVHYLFSDDDPEILTNACLEALHTNGQDGKVEERCVIVDLASDGKAVTSAPSLSKDWQALQTTLAQAPSWGEEAKSEDRGMMLKISGQENRRGGGGKRMGESLDDLVAAFSEKLESLDEVLGRPQGLVVEHKGLE